MAHRKKYRWQDIKRSARQGDSLHGPVKVIGHVPKIPIVPPQQRYKRLPTPQPVN